ncbi:hypothetical protein [Stenotrophomonas phage RAS14]
MTILYGFDTNNIESKTCYLYVVTKEQEKHHGGLIEYMTFYPETAMARKNHFAYYDFLYRNKILAFLPNDNNLLYIYYEAV